MMGAQHYYCTDLISYPSPYYCTFCKGFICTPQVTCLEGKGKLRGGRRLPKARPTKGGGLLSLTLSSFAPTSHRIRNTQLCAMFKVEASITHKIRDFVFVEEE
jgi:hypothetical protein